MPKLYGFSGVFGTNEIAMRLKPRRPSFTMLGEKMCTSFSVPICRWAVR